MTLVATMEEYQGSRSPYVVKIQAALLAAGGIPAMGMNKKGINSFMME